MHLPDLTRMHYFILFFYLFVLLCLLQSKASENEAQQSLKKGLAEKSSVL